MWIDVLRFLGIYLSLLLLIACIGYSALKLYSRTFNVSGFYTGLFLSLLFGLIILVCVFALFKTRLLTVCIFFPLVFFLGFYRKNIRLNVLYDFPAISRGIAFYASLVLLALLPFIYFSLVTFKTGDFHFNTLAYDNALYSELSVFLAKSGIENRWVMFFSDLSFVKGVEPYHYVDSWLNALSLSITGLNPLLLFYLVTYPVLMVITLCGILALIERFREISIPEFIAAVFLVSIGPIYQVKMANYHFNSMACEVPLQHFGEKYLVYYPFILFGILLFLNNYFREMILWLLSLAIVSSTTLPALFAFLFFCVFFLKDQKIRVTAKLALFFIFYMVFFSQLSFNKDSHSNAVNMLGFTDFNTRNFDLAWLKLSISNFTYSFFINLKYFLANYFYTVPLFIYFVFSEKSRHLKLLLVLPCYCFFGLIASSFFYKLPDSHQLFTNTLPLLHCLVITLIIVLFNKIVNNYIRILVLAFTGIFFINTLSCSLSEYSVLHEGASVSDTYLLQIKKMIQNDPKAQSAGFIFNQRDDEYLKLNPDSNYLSHLPYLGINARPLSMSIMETNNDKCSLMARKSWEVINKHELYYGFYLELSGDAQNSDTLKLRFIKKHHLNYLLIGPTTPVPSFITAENSSIISDPKTHICFVRLHNSGSKLK